MTNNQITHLYLEKWKTIEGYINKNTDRLSNNSFKNKIEELSKKDSLIRINIDEIKQMYSIRNMIAHQKSSQYFAYPNEYTLSKIIELVDRIERPIYLSQVIKNIPITFNSDESIITVLNEMKSSNISQFPIYDDNTFISMITSNSISLWLSNNIDKDNLVMANMQDILVNDVIKYNEESDKAIILSKNTTVEDFITLKDETIVVSAWIITENGKNTEKPLCIVSNSDISYIYESVLRL